ncbi:MAG: hypothetical protein R2704_00625 [Microthrixaceae bacterium]
MSVFGTVNRVYGYVDPVLEQYLAGGIDRLVPDLIERALVKWRDGGFVRFDDYEANCTIQVFRWMVAERETNPDFHCVHPRLEWVQPTPEMFAAKESASHMRRPDIRLTIGDSAAWTVECKRLKLSDNLPRLYVDEGLERFVSGSYGASEATGAMIGYIIDDSPRQIVKAINRRVVEHAVMGAGHELKRRARTKRLLNRYVSQHRRSSHRKIEIEHYHADVR